MSQQVVIPVSGVNELTLENFNDNGNETLVQQLVSLVDGGRSHPVLFFWGISGSGKTHLLSACCELAASDGRPYRYLSLGDDGIDLLTTTKLEPKTLICLDNLQRLNSRNLQQPDLLLLYEQTIASGGSLIATARVPLNQIEIELPDLESRLSSGGTFHLQMLSDIHKRHVLQQRAVLRGFELNNKVLDFIMSRFDRDTVSLFALLDLIDSASLAHQRKITVPFVRSIMQ